MPNLVGLFDPGADEAELGASLSRMIRAVDLPAFRFLHRRHLGPGLAIANVLPGVEANTAQPVRDPSERYVLFLDGEILNGRELLPELKERGQDLDGKDDAELALAAFLAFGDGFQRRLVGAYNLVLIDRAQRLTRLYTDRLGSRLLFCAEDQGRYVFGSELKAVIAGRKVRSKVGGVGLYGLLRGGAFEGDRTYLEGIHLVPPGTVVELSARGRTQHRYAKLRFNEGGPELSEDEYAEGFARILRTATDRCLKQWGERKIALTLSGGLDSRAVALSIDPSRRPLRAITYGSEESADVRYARQLAQVLGLDHLYIEPEYERLVAESEQVFRRLSGEDAVGGFYSAQLDRILWRSEGLTLFFGLASPIWHPIYSREMAFMLNGAAGDAMTGSHLTPNLLLSPRRDQVIQDLFRRRYFQDPAAVRPLLNPNYARAVEAELLPAFTRDFQEIDADDPMALSNVWDLEVRQRRGSFTSFTMERYFCTCRSPFLDDELVDFLCRVPGRFRFQQRVYKRMLVRYHPEAAHVPWAYTEGRITDSPAFEFGREVYNFAKAKVAAKLPGRRGQPARWAFRDAKKMMQEDPALHRALLRFTEAEYFPDEILDRAGVRAMAEEFRRTGDPSRHALFTHLVGLGRAIEFFLVPSHIEVPPTADPANFGVRPA